MRDTPLLGEILWEWVNQELPVEPGSANRAAAVAQVTSGELRAAGLLPEGGSRVASR
ncbi:MAG TPA: hypothetical protein VK217_03640 [Acidimicrobiales bacterium]|nr:hypothetical protein [Acidimicrobiales bacterium]